MTHKQQHKFSTFFSKPVAGGLLLLIFYILSLYVIGTKNKGAFSWIRIT